MTRRSGARARRLVGRATSLAGSLAMVLVLVAPGLFSATSVAEAQGNTGTVKINGVPFDQLPNNEPHPGCAFQVTFFNFPSGPVHVSYAFALQPPSGGASLVSNGLDFSGGQGYDAATGAIDLSGAITSAGATLQRNQGYHVKLTVDTGQGAGKHKVFWVNCASTQIPTGTIGLVGLAVILGLGFAVLQRRRSKAPSA